MMAPFDARTVEHGAVCRVLFQDLALEDAAVLERKIENVPTCRVGHRVELHDRCGPTDTLQGVAHTTQIPMTTVQTPDSVERLSRRHLRHTRE